MLLLLKLLSSEILLTQVTEIAIIGYQSSKENTLSCLNLTFIVQTELRLEMEH